MYESMHSMHPPLSLVVCHRSPVACHPPPVVRCTSSVTCHPSPVACHPSLVSRYPSSSVIVDQSLLLGHQLRSVPCRRLPLQVAGYRGVPGRSREQRPRPCAYRRSDTMMRREGKHPGQCGEGESSHSADEEGIGGWE